MPTFEQPNDKMKTAFDKVRALDCHQERLAEVKIVVLAAYAKRDKDDEPRGEALARNGDPILGMIRIMSLEDRSDGSADVRVLLHGDRWGQLSASMQRSVVDDCLMRIEVMMQDGKSKLDELGRPKLRKRKWGFQLCGFHEVAERHGKSSIEVHNFRVLFDEHGQTYLPWFDDDEPLAKILELAPRRKPMAAVSGDGTHKRGSLAAKPLRDRLQHIDGPATLLAVAQLEFGSKPRKGVVAALKDRVLELKGILRDFNAVEKGQTPSVELDLAAAVLVTSPAKLSTEILDSLVPECRDAKVLGWILDDEGDDAPREHVLEVVNRRIRELS